MSFLRSVIADARPRKAMREPLNGPSAITGWKSRALEGNDFGAEQKSPSVADQTSRLSQSLSIREGVIDVNMGDAPAFQVDNPLNQGIQDMGSNVELESPLSVPTDKSEPIPNDESSIRLDPVNLPEQQLYSEGDKASKAEGSMTPQPAGTVIPNSRMNSSMSQSHDPAITFPETHGAQNRVSGHEGIEPVSFPASIRDTSAQEEVAGVIATDDQRYSDGSIKGTETLTIQADATQTTALTLPVKSRQIESSVLEASLVPSVHSPDSFGNSTSDNTAGRNEVEKALADPETHGAQNRVSGHEGIEPVSFPASIRDTSAQEEVAGVIATDDQRYSDGSIKGTETLTIQADATQTTALTLPVKSRQIESSVLEASLVPSVHSPDSFGNSTSDNTAGRNEVEKALADGGKARQVSPSVDKQADMKSLSNQEETPRLQKLDEAKGVLRDVQLVSRQAMAMDSPIASDIEHAWVPQSAGKKVQASASSPDPDPAPSKPGNSEQHVARPAKPSASPEALRSVPATPFQTDSIPKAGGTFRSRPPLRSPEKTHEAPKVQIGQIDVIIEATAQPAIKPAPAQAPIDLASRNYLRRL